MRIWRDDPDHSDFTVYLDDMEVRASGADEVEGWVIVNGEKLFGKVKITTEEKICHTCAAVPASKKAKRSRVK